jgi:hypothetical protein
MNPSSTPGWDSSRPLGGACFCGAVRYRCGAPLYPPTFCHCTSCRRIAGAHSIAWLTVAVESLDFPTGKPSEFSSSAGVFRSYCGQCGTPLTYRQESRPGEVDLILTTLDQAADLVPLSHIWMEDALPWDRPSDGLPQFPKTRGGS